MYVGSVTIYSAPPLLIPTANLEYSLVSACLKLTGKEKLQMCSDESNFIAFMTPVSLVRSYS